MIYAIKGLVDDYLQARGREELLEGTDLVKFYSWPEQC